MQTNSWFQNHQFLGDFQITDTADLKRTDQDRRTNVRQKQTRT